MECPYDGCDLESTERAIKTHHKRVHGESLVDNIHICDNCGQEFERYPSQIPDDAENIYCSMDCKSKDSKLPKGDVICPYDGCDHQSTELGIQQHHKRTHGISLTDIEIECDNCCEKFTRQRSVDKQYDLSFCTVECKTEYLSEKYSEEWIGEDHPSWNGHTKEVERECGWCEEFFTTTKGAIERGRGKFCSRECYSSDLATRSTGEDHPFWKGGGDRYYGPKNEWAKTRQKVLERDSFECQDCGMDNEDHKNEYGCELHIHHITPRKEFNDYEEANKLNNLITYCVSCHSKHDTNIAVA
jgi:predicted HNH restriction endonuclease